MVRMAAGELGGGERVLFIEDSPTLAQLLEVSLVQAGYEVLRATSGEEGLELARAEVPDLLLCDVMLPASTASRWSASSGATSPPRTSASSC